MPTAKLRQDTALVKLLRGAVEAEKEDDGWSNLSAIGTNIRNRGPFDARNYGYGKLSGLIEATGLFEIRRGGDKHPSVRAKPKATKAAKAAKSKT